MTFYHFLQEFCSSEIVAFLLIRLLMGFTFEYMYLTRQPKVVGHLTLTFDVAVQSFLKTDFLKNQISTQLRVILDIRKR